MLCTLILCYLCDDRMRSTSAGIGLAGHSVILCMLSGARALLIALCLQVHTKGGKLRYKYSSARPHGHLVLVCRGTMFIDYCIFTDEGVPEYMYLNV